MNDRKIVYLRVVLVVVGAAFGFAFVRGVSTNELLGLFAALCYLVLFAVLSLVHFPRSLYPHPATDA
jgi:hypothetical protein